MIMSPESRLGRRSGDVRSVVLCSRSFLHHGVRARDVVTRMIRLDAEVHLIGLDVIKRERVLLEFMVVKFLLCVCVFYRVYASCTGRKHHKGPSWHTHPPRALCYIPGWFHHTGVCGVYYFLV